MPTCLSVCELGCETGTESCGTSLYELLPTVARTQSLLADGLIDESDTAESVLKKIVYALEMEYCTTRNEITSLLALVSVDYTPSAYLGYLAETTLAPYSSSWSADKRRMVIKGTAILWMAKATARSFSALFRLHGYSSIDLWELWKSEIYEVDDYGPYQNYNYPYKSARVRMAISGDPENNPTLSQARYEIMPLLESLRPIHILLEPEFLGPADTIDTWPAACDSRCEGSCETTDETGLEIEPDLVTGVPTETQNVSDSITITMACVHWCESSCQSSGCQLAGCQSGSCETGCESICETTCQSACTTGCETSCEWYCQLGGCQSNCEFACMTDCQVECQVSACEIQCQTFVMTATACDFICQVSCQASGCETSCETGEVETTP